MEWFAQQAMDMPLDYVAIIVAHFATDTKGFELFKGSVDAFSGKCVYTGEFGGSGAWMCYENPVAYRNCNGEIIAIFQDHKHVDTV